MEARLARLEGAYEQIDRRLTDFRHEVAQRFASLEARLDGIDSRIGSLESRLDGRIDSLTDRMDRKFTAVYGLIVGTWITTVLTIVFHH
jgi:tetrahydromethanopterin S-methyltransferase subunit G